jgi:hypothetical protein
MPVILNLYPKLHKILTLRFWFSSHVGYSNLKVLPMVTSNCRHPGYKTKDPINTFWRGRLQVIEHLFANMVFAHCMETTPYTLFELEEHILLEIRELPLKDSLDYIIYLQVYSLVYSLLFLNSLP